MQASDYPYFQKPFLALAHRGGSDWPANRGRENTLHAFGQAVALGYTHLETDVHATRDGRLVAFHDDVLDRVTDGHGSVAQTDFATLRRARIAGIDQIPTLDEVLESFPQARINIDIKAPGAVEPLVECLRAHRAQDRVCVGSFGARRLNRFRRLMGGRVATAAGPVGVAWAARMPVLPRLLASPGVALQIPEETTVRGRRVRILTPWLLDAAHRRGKVVHVWTVNDATRMHQLIDHGVDGLVTDEIGVLREVLVERGLWQQGPLPHC
ncbi:MULTISPECIES: glycerophosphodiester phosphodiesterase [unclassified Luteococcus]|uniref:glycerophosphodiester phosphodiesterase n=1 Tax=unclassified Luteococcus TaxID=2639923 RepID=UPI00313BB7A0